MKKYVLPLVLAAGLALTACGSSSNEADEPEVDTVNKRDAFALCLDSYEAEVGFPEGMERPEYENHWRDIMERADGWEVATDVGDDVGMLHCMVMLNDAYELEDVAVMGA